QRSAWAHEIGRLLGLQQGLDIRLSQAALESAQRGARPQSVVENSLRRLERVRPRQRLQHLHTTPMTVQITERAQVDQDIERQRVPAAVLTEQIIVPSARAGRKVEHLVDPRLR